MKIWICLCANQSFCVCVSVCGTSVEVVWSIWTTETNAVRMLVPECTNHTLDDSMVMIMIYVHTHILLHYSTTIRIYDVVRTHIFRLYVWQKVRLIYHECELFAISNGQWFNCKRLERNPSATYSKRNGILYINIIHQLDMPYSWGRRQWASER